MLRHAEKDFARERGPEELRVGHGDLGARRDALGGRDHDGLAILEVVRRIRRALVVEQPGQREEGARDHLLAIDLAATLKGVRIEGADRAIEVLEHVRVARKVLEALGGPLHLAHVVAVRVRLHRIEQLALRLAEEEAAHHAEDAQGPRLNDAQVLGLPFPEELALDGVPVRGRTIRTDGQAAAGAAERRLLALARRLVVAMDAGAQIAATMRGGSNQQRVLAEQLLALLNVAHGEHATPRYRRVAHTPGGRRRTQWTQMDVDQGGQLLRAGIDGHLWHMLPQLLLQLRHELGWGCE